MESKNLEEFDTTPYTYRDIEKFTVEEFQARFDELMERVEFGEHIAITDGENTAIMVPATDDIVRLYTELNNEAP